MSDRKSVALLLDKDSSAELIPFADGREVSIMLRGRVVRRVDYDDPAVIELDFAATEIGISSDL